LRSVAWSRDDTSPLKVSTVQPNRLIVSSFAGTEDVEILKVCFILDVPYSPPPPTRHEVFNKLVHRHMHMADAHKQTAICETKKRS
jgi:hypothetical protein